MNLSRLAIALVALICLLGIAEQWAGTGDTVTLWRIAAAVLVGCLLYEALLVRRLPLEALPQQPLRFRLGRRENLALGLANRSSRPCQIEYVLAPPAVVDVDLRERTLRLPPGSEVEQVWEVTSTDLGRHPWSAIPARVLGPLGLAWWPRRIAVDIDIEVVPDLLGAANDAQGEVKLGARSASIGSGPELHHLRDYAPGDPLHRIDWKATAKTGDLVTRVYTEEQHLDIMLVLDLGRTARTHIDGLSQFSHYVNFAARFAQFAAASGDRVGLIAAADEPRAFLPPQASAGAVTAVRETLLGLQAQPVETDLLSAALLLQQSIRHRSLVVLLTDLYSQSLSGDFGRALRLWGSRHLPMVVGLVGADVSRLAQQDSRRQVDPYISLASQDYRSVVAGNAEGAKRLGATPVVTGPSELQPRVFEEYRRLRQSRRV